ncbi:hypothetical protein MRCP2_p1520 (plasmid) [Aquipseudomonas alcaligenes]|nr:hypothetical protein MRCP2_p1520 [Pseudomonas alcaligenes]
MVRASLPAAASVSMGFFSVISGVRMARREWGAQRPISGEIISPVTEMQPYPSLCRRRLLGRLRLGQLALQDPVAVGSAVTVMPTVIDIPISQDRAFRWIEVASQSPCTAFLSRSGW